MRNIEIERLKKLPMRAHETWQGDWVRLPRWMAEPGEKPRRVWVPLWVSVRTELAGQGGPCCLEDRNFARVLTALVEFAGGRFAGHRPGRLEVRDPALAEHLAGMLAEVGIEVVTRDELAALARCLADIQNRLQGGRALPGPFADAGVTVERMRAFAEAAEAFYHASPWDALSEADLIQIGSPHAPRGLGFATVLGETGRICGLGLFRSSQEYWLLQAGGAVAGRPGPEPGREIWSVQFVGAPDLPIGDADLWEDHGLPVAGDEAYPLVIGVGAGGRIRRADAPLLLFVEGLLRALAATTEAEIDTGRWAKPVETAGGAVEYRLALPDLLAPPKREDLVRRGVMPDGRAMERLSAQMSRYLAEHPVGSREEMDEVMRRQFFGKTADEVDSPPRTAAEEAQDLCYEAFGAVGRRRIQLARQAIQVCPDCADAYVILAERTRDPQKALGLWSRAVDAGTRTLGADRLERHAGHFWGIVDTRPYMRARLGLAKCLATAGRTAEAVEHYQALLRLNPGDNQGVRFRLVPKLIELGQDAAAQRTLDQFEDDCSAVMLYSRALLAFRAGGAGPAGACLRKARQGNAHVAAYLLGEKDLPDRPPSAYSPGGEAEAVICLSELFGAWQATPGAMEWLAEEERQTTRRVRKRQKAKRRKKRRK